MDSEPKKPQFDEHSGSEIEEEKWIDLLASVIIQFKDCERREKNLLKFLLLWLEETISNKKEKEDVGKFEEALEILKDHVELISNKMNEAKNFEKMTMGRYVFHRHDKDDDSSDSE
jgi:hypothetical protein